MGYWHAHPLAGDEPQDSILTLAQALGCDDQMDLAFPQRLDEACSSVSGVRSMQNLLCENQHFVLPFILVEHRITVLEPLAVLVLGTMIGDAGAKCRGYGPYDPQSPCRYANQLAQYWEGLMAGLVPFEQIRRAPGLAETLEDEIEATELGSIGNDD